MPVTAKELREKRAALAKQARGILDKAEAEKRDLTAEERQAWDRIMGGNDPQGNRVVGEEERLKSQIDTLERQERFEDEMKNPIGGNRGNGGPGREDGPAGGQQGVTEEQRALAMQAWVLNGRGQELRDEHREACRATGINYRSNELVLNLRRDNYARMRYTYTGLEQRAGSALPQATALIASGGALVPEGFINNVEIALLQYGGIRNVADVMRTESGNDLPWPTVNDTAVKGRRLAENAQINTKDITFGVCTFRAYLYTSDIVLVPVSLIQDAAINLSNLVGSLCGERIGRIQSDEFTTHTGNAGPMGIVPAATSGVSAAVATAIAADDLYSLKHSVDPAYRKGAQFMMHDSILLAIKKLKDGMGRYLWQASLAGGSPDTLDGDPIQINQSMDSTLASGKKPVLYGQLSKYKIRDVGEIRLRRLVERYADLDQEAFLCLMRSDGNLLDAGTHPVKYIAN